MRYLVIESSLYEDQKLKLSLPVDFNQVFSLGYLLFGFFHVYIAFPVLVLRKTGIFFAFFFLLEFGCEELYDNIG